MQAEYATSIGQFGLGAAALATAAMTIRFRYGFRMEMAVVAQPTCPAPFCSASTRLPQNGCRRRLCGS